METKVSFTTGEMRYANRLIRYAIEKLREEQDKNQSMSSQLIFESWMDSAEHIADKIADATPAVPTLGGRK